MSVCSIGITKSKMYFQKKSGNSEGWGGGGEIHDYGILRAWGGGNAFWNFRSQGGVKTWKPSVVGYGYFMELPIQWEKDPIVVIK